MVDFKQVRHELGLKKKVTDKSLIAMIEWADKDKDGELNEKEFIDAAIWHERRLEPSQSVSSMMLSESTDHDVNDNPLREAREDVGADEALNEGSSFVVDMSRGDSVEPVSNAQSGAELTNDVESAVEALGEGAHVAVI